MLKKSRPYTVSVALTLEEKQNLEELTMFFFQNNMNREITKSDIIRIALKQYYGAYLNWKEESNEQKN